MKQVERFQKQIRGLFDAIFRFPLTSVLLVILIIVNTVQINNSSISNFNKYIATLIMGAVLAAVAQMIYERFFDKSWEWIFLMAVSVVLTLAYFIMIFQLPEFELKITVKTAVMLAALYMAFIWIPTIKNKVKFHESFMVNFKGIFISLFFSLVFFLGTSLIFTAVDQLLISVSYKLYSHGANIIFALFAPIYFLSITPKYPGEGVKQSEEDIDYLSSAIACPKYVMILISYIIIPITIVFTVILILYIILNIGQEFWTNNLLEPMLVSYAITVIFVYLLSCGLENKLVKVFKKIFPKILVPIVLLQTVSSIIKISELGLTHGRYYVILFGIFAILSGIIFSIRATENYGLIAVVFIVFCLISIFPSIDAFSISKRSQIKVLEETLTRNEMLINNKIIPRVGIPEEDKAIIRKSVENLNFVGDLKELYWLPIDFSFYDDFTEVFGFGQYEYNDNGNRYINLNLSRDRAIDISSYDAFIPSYLNIYEDEAFDKFPEETVHVIIKGGKYDFIKYGKDNKLLLIDENGKEIISIDTKDLMEYYKEKYSENQMYEKDYKEMSIEEAVYNVNNSEASMTIIPSDISLYESLDSTQFSANVYILININ